MHKSSLIASYLLYNFVLSIFFVAFIIIQPRKKYYQNWDQ